jgi:hypothetical protein
MKEINIELETLFDRYLADDVNTKLQGQIFDIKVENEYGSGYGVSGKLNILLITSKKTVSLKII